MSVKSIIVNDHARHFGRRRPRFRYPRLSFKNYLGLALPNPPSIWSWRPDAIPALAQMYMNDSLGDCVIACIEHCSGVLTGNSTGIPVIYNDANTIRLYSAIGGYVPGDPSTDNGCDIQTALAYYGTNGLLADGSHKIQGYLAIDPTNQLEVKWSIFLTGNNILGLELPDEWVNPFPSESGFIWDVAGDPDPDNGHCVLALAYGVQGVLISTWGMTGIMTWAALAKYCSASVSGELYSVLSNDFKINIKNKAPNGFDWTQLQADFQAIK